MRVAIFNYESPESLRVRKLLLNRLEEETAITYDEQQPDVVITIGGDGTLISAFHHYEDRLSTIRFVGIHTGHLGFYTDWRNFAYELKDWREALLKAGFNQVEVKADFGSQAIDEKTTRWFFICRKQVD